MVSRDVAECYLGRQETVPALGAALRNRSGIICPRRSLRGCLHERTGFGSLVLALTIPAARGLFLNRQKRFALLILSLPAISAAVAITLSTATWLPLLGLLTHVHREPAILAHQLAGAIPFRSFVQGLVFPWSSVSPGGKGPDFGSFAFVGIPALIFVPAGFLRRSGLVVLAGIAGLVSLGIIWGFRPLIIFLRLLLPYFGAWKLYDGFFLLCFAIAVLAGMGLSETTRRIARPDLSRYLLIALASPPNCRSILSTNSIRLDHKSIAASQA